MRGERVKPAVWWQCGLLPRIVQHILQSKRIPPKYLGFSPRFMVNKFYIINRKSNFLRMEIFLRLFHFCSHSRREGGGGGVLVFQNRDISENSHFDHIYIGPFITSFRPSFMTFSQRPHKSVKATQMLCANVGMFTKTKFSVSHTVSIKTFHMADWNMSWKACSDEVLFGPGVLNWPKWPEFDLWVLIIGKMAE